MPFVTPKTITTADGDIVAPYEDGERTVEINLDDIPETVEDPIMTTLVLEEINRGDILKLDTVTGEYVPKSTHAEDCNKTIYMLACAAQRAGVRKEWFSALMRATYYNQATGAFRYTEYAWLVRAVFYNGAPGSFGSVDDFPSINRIFVVMAPATNSPGAGGNSTYAFQGVASRLVKLMRSKVEARLHPEFTYVNYAAVLIELQYADFTGMYDSKNNSTQGYVDKLNRARSQIAAELFMIACDDPLMQREFVGESAFPNISGLTRIKCEGRTATGVKRLAPGDAAIRSSAEIMRIVADATNGLCPGSAKWPANLLLAGGLVSKAAMASIGPKSPVFRITDCDVYSTGPAEKAIHSIQQLADTLVEMYGWAAFGVMSMRSVLTVHPVGCQRPWQIIAGNTPGTNPAYGILRLFDTSHSKFAMYVDSEGQPRVTMSVGAYLSAVSGVSVMHRTFGNIPMRCVKAVTMGVDVCMSPELYAQEAEIGAIFGTNPEKFTQLQRKYMYPESMPTGDPNDDYVREGAMAALHRDAAHYATGLVTGDAEKAISALEIHPDMGLLVNAAVPVSPMSDYVGAFVAGIGKRNRVEAYTLPDGNTTKTVMYTGGAPATISAIALPLEAVLGGVQDDVKSPFTFIVRADATLIAACVFLEDTLAMSANAAPLTARLIDNNGIAKIVLSEELYGLVVAANKSPIYNTHGRPLNPDDWANKLDCEGITLSCTLGIEYSFKAGSTKEYTLVPAGPVRLLTPYARAVADDDVDADVNAAAADTADFGDDLLV